jgi:hypothetical protein
MSLLYTAGWDFSKWSTFSTMDYLVGMYLNNESKFIIAGFETIDDPPEYYRSILDYDTNASYKYSHLDIHDAINHNGDQLLLTEWADDGFANILQETLAAAAVAAGANYSPTVSFSPTTGKYTLGYAGGFWLLFDSGSGVKELMGFSGNKNNGLTSYTSDYVSKYCVFASQDHLSKVSDEYEPKNVASQAISDGGYSIGMARTKTLIYMDWTQTFETHEKTMARKAETANPWTFQHLYEHCRTIYPFVVYTPDYYDGHYPLCLLREDGCQFKPERDHPDYDGHWHIPFKTYLYGWL